MRKDKKKSGTAYWIRTFHRDLGYFFVGLIIAFSISGIALNHRKSFDPQEYVIEVKQVEVELPSNRDDIHDDFYRNIAKEWELEGSFRGVRRNGNNARVYYKNAYLSLDLTTGSGELELSKTIPVLGQMTILHKTTNVWWIWFSDIFGIAMLIIAVTGMFIAKSKNSFKRRGWWLSSLGLIFPFIFLFGIY